MFAHYYLKMIMVTLLSYNSVHTPSVYEKRYIKISVMLLKGGFSYFTLKRQLILSI